MTPTEILTGIRPALFAIGMVAIGVAVFFAIGARREFDDHFPHRRHNRRPVDASAGPPLGRRRLHDRARLEARDQRRRDEPAPELQPSPAWIEAAVSQTERLVDRPSAIGLPPSARTGAANERVHAVAETGCRPSSAHVRSATSDLEGGNPLAALAAINDVGAISGLASQFARRAPALRVDRSRARPCRDQRLPTARRAPRL